MSQYHYRGAALRLTIRRRRRPFLLALKMAILPIAAIYFLGVALVMALSTGRRL